MCQCPSAPQNFYFSPVEQEIQDLPGGGEGSVSAEEDGDVGGVFAPEGRHHVLHQPLQRAGLDGPHLARLVEAQGGVRLHAQPSLPLAGRLVELHLPQRDGEDGVLLRLLADLLRRALAKRKDTTRCSSVAGAADSSHSRTDGREGRESARSAAEPLITAICVARLRFLFLPNAL